MSTCFFFLDKVHLYICNDRTITLNTFYRSDQGCRSVSRYALPIFRKYLLMKPFMQKYPMKARWRIWYGQIRIRKKKISQYRLGNYLVLLTVARPLIIRSTEVQATRSALASCTNSWKQIACCTSSVRTNYAWKATLPSSRNISRLYGPHQIIAIAAVTLLVY
jgi:hypothetical protein